MRLIPAAAFVIIAASLPDLAFTQVSSPPIGVDAALVGTWSTKSGKVVTGSAFFDPTTDRFHEPQLTGISYSFSVDGHYEEAYFRAIANPADPSCPASILQFQHGTFIPYSNGSLDLTPLASDGRQLTSSPCSGPNTATLTRYDQSELFSKYEVLQDPYNGKQRLNLFAWDGTPMNPMWLVVTPPEMLPTGTLLPTSTAGAKVKRAIRSWDRIKRKTGSDVIEGSVKRWLWWTGAGMVAAGGVLLYCT